MAPVTNSHRPLEALRIASPCPARWEEMEGSDSVRFCQQCRKNVYNLSALTRSEAEELVARQEGRMCATFFRRADGKVLTADCPVGRGKRRARFLRRIAAAAAAVLGIFGGQFLTSSPKPASAPDTVPARDLEDIIPTGGRPISPEDLKTLEQLVGSLAYVD